LTKWHLDVISETRYSEAMQNGYDSLVSLPDVGISLADALYEKGFFSAHELSKASVEDLIQIRDITEEKAVQLIEAAKEYILSMSQADETSKEAIPEEIDDDDDIPDVSDSFKTSEEQTGSDEDQTDETSEEAIPEEIDDDNDIPDVSDSFKASEEQTGSDEDVAKQTILTDDKEADSAEQ
jgi:N utilization substance protein A